MGAPEKGRSCTRSEKCLCPSYSPDSVSPVAHLFPRTAESFHWWVEKSRTRCIQHPAAEEALVLLSLALLFSSNKKVVVTHSIKKQKQSCNRLKGCCLDAEREVCKRRKVSCRSGLETHTLLPAQGRLQVLPREVIFLPPHSDQHFSQEECVCVCVCVRRSLSHPSTFHLGFLGGNDARL